jgi:hypothetical protein
LNIEVFRGLEFRSIGPSLTTRRISDLEIDPNNSSVWYLTVGSGGLWKTVNRGRRQPRGEVVSPGRYTATLGRLTGEALTDLGEPQTVLVVPLQR